MDMHRIEVDDEVFQLLQQKAVPLVDSPNSVLRRLLLGKRRKGRAAILMEEPVVQIVEESTGEILYTLRVQGDRFRPRVFVEGGTYTVIVGEPGTDRLRTIRGVTPTADADATLKVDLLLPG